MREKMRIAEKKPKAENVRAVSQIQRTDNLQPESSNNDRMMILQKNIGNQAVQRLIGSGALQTKLKIGRTNDIFARESDKGEDQMMRMPELNEKISGQMTEKEEEENQGGLILTGQGGSTPDGNTLGPTDPTKRTCLASNRLIWVGGPDQNTTTAATGRSRVTARLGTSPADGPDCDCGCGLFRQYIRGFWRRGSPTAPKQHDVSSCGNTITMNESSWTEEFEACNPGGAPISASCNRTYLDTPGFSAGLSDGTFVQVHLDLRYQMWDQCRGRAVATGDRRLRIRGDRRPRTISFG